MPRWLLVTMLTVLVTGCYNTPPRGGRTPYPPGPLDTVNILLRNDYSRLCPEGYDYCRAGKRSICCPKGACCHDGVAPYCCDAGYDTRDDYDRGYGYGRDRGYERSPGGGGPCGPDATTCSRGGVTICCGPDEGCCSDAQGLYCCGGRGY
jgi:hypothetical protein